LLGLFAANYGHMQLSAIAMPASIPQGETPIINTVSMTSLSTYFTSNRLGSTPATNTAWLGGSSPTASARTDLAGNAMRSQVASEAAAVRQGARNATHTVTVLQDAADNLEAISDALDEMETLVDQAAAGALWATEESIGQIRIDELLVEIDRLANLTTDRAVNLLANGSGTIAITLGRGNAAAAETIQVPKFDMTTQGLNLASLQLKGADTAARIDAAVASVDSARTGITSILPRMNAAIRSVGASADVLSAAGTPIADTVEGQEVADTIRRQLTGSMGMGMTFQMNVLSQTALDLLGVPTTTPRSETVLPWHVTSLV